MRNICMLVFSLLFVAVTSQLNGYTFFNEVNKSYKFHASPKLWHEAAINCRSEGASLAMPRNAKEIEILKTIFSTFPASSLAGVTHRDYALIGFNDAFVEGIYITDNGETLDTYFNTWGGGQPDNSGNEDCGSFHRGGVLNDFPCNVPGVFICENKPRDIFAREPPCRLSSDSEYFLNEAAGKFYKFHKKARTWQNAIMACRQEEAELAMPSNYIEALALSNIFSGYPSSTLPGLTHPDYILLGFHDGIIEGQFLDLKGDYLSTLFRIWGHGQPDNAGDEDCGSLHRTMVLNDYPCSVPAVFICQKDKVNDLNQSSNVCSSQDADFAYYPDVKLYYKFHENSKMWSEASRVCQNEGASLAMPADDQQAEVLRHIFARYPANSLHPLIHPNHMLMGFHDKKTEGIFVTEDGQSISTKYHTWNSGEPNNGLGSPLGAEDCGSMDRQGKLNDFPCALPTVFVCQKSTLSTPKTQVFNVTTVPLLNDIFYSFKDNRQYHLHKVGLHWSGAERACRDEFSWLTVVNSADEAELLTGAMNVLGLDHALVGISSNLFNGLFTNNEGILVENLGYNIWASDQDSITHKCGALRNDMNLIAVPCETPAIFFCERRIRPDKPSIGTPA